MLCNYLNNIYNDYINPNLSNDEFKYSENLKQKILDIWFSVDNIKTNPIYPKIKFYFLNNKLIFEFDGECLRFCNMLIDNFIEYEQFHYMTKQIFEFELKIGNVKNGDMMISNYFDKLDI